MKALYHHRHLHLHFVELIEKRSAEPFVLVTGGPEAGAGVLCIGEGGEDY